MKVECISAHHSWRSAGRAQSCSPVELSGVIVGVGEYGRMVGWVAENAMTARKASSVLMKTRKMLESTITHPGTADLVAAMICSASPPSISFSSTENMTSFPMGGW